MEYAGYNAKYVDFKPGIDIMSLIIQSVRRDALCGSHNGQRQEKN